MKPAFSEEIFQAHDGLILLFLWWLGSQSRRALRKAIVMLIYMFTSETSPNLHAFAGDPSGSKLPESHAPWTAAGLIKSDQHPPHRFSRAKIEEAIKLSGFQLWRLKPSTET